MSRKDFICSFCNRKQAEVKKLIVGPSVYICDFCTNICAQILQENECNTTDTENSNETNTNKKNNLLTPQDIYSKLDEVVASQENAKRELALTAYLHHLKIQKYKAKQETYDTNNKSESKVELNETETTVKLNKNNLLLIGPTGSGKTLLVYTLSKILDIACIIIDANGLTEAGYVGDDVEGIVKKLFLSIYSEGQNIQDCILKAEFAIICIDEIDKKQSVDSTTNRDVSGKGVQQNFLRIMEGTDVQITLDSRKSNETITINTSNMLFITMGAFEGLDKIIARHLKQSNALGVITTPNIITEIDRAQQVHHREPIYFLQKKEEEYNRLIPFFKKEYLLDFGIIKELLGRLHTIVFFKKLSEEDLIDILCHKKNNLIEEYSYILKLHNMQLIYDETVIRTIAQEAITENMGARSLRSIVHKIFSPALFNIPSIYQQDIGKKHLIRLIKTPQGKVDVKIEEVTDLTKEKDVEVMKSVSVTA